MLEKIVKRGIAIVILVLFGLVLIVTNPSQADVEQHIKNEEGIISMVFVEKRANYVFFAMYQVNISSLKQGLFEDRYYIGVLGQVIAIN